MKDSTEIVFLLDCSGSMHALVPETIVAVNNFIAEQKKVGGAANMSLYTFDTKLRHFFTSMPIEMVQPIESLVTGDMTALYDALADTIDATGARLRVRPESERPSKVVFVVLTDGHENMSRRTTKDAVLARIAHQKTKYAWQFLFLGADADAFDDAAKIGISYAQTMSWEPHRPGGILRAFLASSNAVSDYRSNNTSEAAYSVNDRMLNNSK